MNGTGSPGAEFKWYDITIDQQGMGGPAAGAGFGPNLEVFTGTQPANTAALGVDVNVVGNYTFLVTETRGIDGAATPIFDGCETPQNDALVVTVTVNAPPAPIINAVNGGGAMNNEFCVDDPDIIISANLGGTGGGAWTSLNAALNDDGITDLGDGRAVFNFANALQAIANEGVQDIQNTRQGSYVVEYTFTDANGCSNSTTTEILINLLPQPVYSVYRGNDSSPSQVLEASSHTLNNMFVVCELDDLSTSTASIDNRIVLLDRTDQAAFGTRVAATFRGRITTDNFNTPFTGDDSPLENLDAGMDGMDDGEAYFYPAAAVAFALNQEADLSDNLFIDFEMDVVYTNNSTCANNISNVNDRVTIRVFREPLPEIDVTIPEDVDVNSQITVCIDHDEPGVDGVEEPDIIFRNDGIVFESGGVLTYSGISLPSGNALTVDVTPGMGISMVPLPGNEAQFFAREAYDEALGFADVDGSGPARFEIIYTYVSDEGCTNTTSPFTVEVHPLPSVEFDPAPIGQEQFQALADVQSSIDNEEIFFPLEERDIVSGNYNPDGTFDEDDIAEDNIASFVPFELCIDGAPVDLNGRGFFGADDGTTENGLGNYTSDQGNFGITQQTGALNATFDPSTAFNLSGGETVHNITFRFTSQEGCQDEITKQFIINEKPVISLDEVGGCNGEAVTFNLNIESLAPGDAVKYIQWNFENSVEDLNDDGVIDAPAFRLNTSLEQNAVWTEEGEQTVTVQVFTEKGCSSVELREDFFVGDIPNTNFIYDGLCVDQPFEFEVLPKAVNIGVVENFTIDYGDGSPAVTVRRTDFIDPATMNPPDEIPQDAFLLTHTFPNANIYPVELTVVTTNGCTSSHTRLVPVLPTIVVTPDEPYIETFEGVAEIIEVTLGTDENGDPVTDLLFVDGWVPDIRNLDDRDENPFFDLAGDRSDNNTWEFGPVSNPNGFISAGANNSANAWVTNLSGPFADNENSWVFTPCFDISALEQPMVRFQRTFEFNDVRDGVVFQYSVDNGKTWQVLGDESEPEGTGLNWYQAEGLQGRPGNQEIGAAKNLVGWGGGAQSSFSSDWTEARHKLDEIPVTDPETGENLRRRVIFRFAIGAQSGDNQSGDNSSEGFGIDDFIIEERSRKVFVEHFTGSFIDGSLIEDLGDLRETLEENTLPSGVLVNNDDAVLVTYKTDIAGQDDLNSLNPSDNNARVVFYGVESLSTTVLNGIGGSSTNISTEQEGPFDENNFNQSSLPDPDITLGITLDPAADDQIAVTVGMTNVGSVAITDDIRLYIAVVEETVEDNNVLIRNLMRKLLPSGSGNELIIDGEGNIEPVSQSWVIQRVTDASNLAVVAWIQNSTTKRVIQAAIVDVGPKGDVVTGIDDEILNSDNIMIYPNPANDLVTVDFDVEISEDFDWALYNQVGMQIKYGMVKQGASAFSIDTSLFPSGMYFLRVGNDDRRFEHFKVVISH